MLRALWFVIKVGLLVAAAVWIADRPGTVDFHWLGYDVTAQTGFALLALFLFLLLFLGVYRIVAGIATAPRRLRRLALERRRVRGQKALVLGLTAVAAGDAKMAGWHALRARKFLPDDAGLPVLLEAQAARLRGDDRAARDAFERLMKNRDTAFLGLRGLLLTALESDDVLRAQTLARQALELHPRQPWVLRMAYDLELRQGDWDEARKILARVERYGALDEARVREDRAAILLQQAADSVAEDKPRAALERLKRAHRIAPSFVPASVRLAQYYLDGGKRGPAARVIAATWKEFPHPELVPLWRAAMPGNKGQDSAARLRWFEKLVALRPDSAESQLAAGAEAVDLGLWGVARQYLDMAESIGAGARLWHLRAKLAQKQNRPEEAALMLRKAADAQPGKVWLCRETGRIYDRWTPVAEPHGPFNTIIWSIPRGYERDSAAADRSELLITAPAALAGRA